MWRGRRRSPTWVGAVDSCTTSWAIQSLGRASTRGPQARQLLVAGLGTDHQAVAARAVDRLEHQLVGVVEGVGQLVGVLEAVGVDVGDDRLLAEVVRIMAGT